MAAAGWVFALSLALRIAWVGFATITPISDAHGYDVLARQLLNSGEFGHGNGAAYRTPGYPAFLGMVYAAFGHSWKAAGYVQAVLGAATSAMVVLLAARTLSTRTAAVAGGLHALSVTALAYVPMTMSENLTVPLAVGGVLLLALEPSGRMRRQLAAGASGIVFGLLLLVRPAALFFMPALLLLALWPPHRRALRPAALLIVLFAASITVSPWLYRNWKIGLGFPVMSTSGGVNLWMGNNPMARTGGYQRSTQFGDTLDEKAMDARYKSSAWRWIYENPTDYARICGVRAARLLGMLPDTRAAGALWPTAEQNRIALAAREAGRGKEELEEMAAKRRAVRDWSEKKLTQLRRISVPLALVALALSLLQPRRFAYALAPALAYGVGLTATYFAERFREPLNPFLYIMMAALLCDLFFGGDEMGRRPRRAVKWMLVVLAVSAAVWASYSDVDRGWYRRRPSVPTARGQVDVRAPTPASDLTDNPRLTILTSDRAHDRRSSCDGESLLRREMLDGACSIERPWHADRLPRLPRRHAILAHARPRALRSRPIRGL